MVCPKCAQMHGQDHAPGCPVTHPRADSAYVAGWDAATAWMTECWRRDRERIQPIVKEQVADFMIQALRDVAR